MNGVHAYGVKHDHVHSPRRREVGDAEPMHNRRLEPRHEQHCDQRWPRLAYESLGGLALNHQVRIPWRVARGGKPAHDRRRTWAPFDTTQSTSKWVTLRACTVLRTVLR